MIGVKDAEPVRSQPALDPARAGDPRRRLRRGGDHPARPRRGAGLDRPHRRGPLGRRGDRADARALDRRGARGDRATIVAPSLNVTLADRDVGRACRWPAPRPRRAARPHQPGPHPGAGLARGQRLAGDARLRGEPLGRRPAERHRRQHQQPHHRRRLPRPPELRLGRHLPHHPRRPAARRPRSTTPATASSRSRPTPCPRRRARCCR